MESGTLSARISSEKLTLEVCNALDYLCDSSDSVAVGVYRRRRRQFDSLVDRDRSNRFDLQSA